MTGGLESAIIVPIGKMRANSRLFACLRVQDVVELTMGEESFGTNVMGQHAIGMANASLGGV